MKHHNPRRVGRPALRTSLTDASRAAAALVACAVLAFLGVLAAPGSPGAAASPEPDATAEAVRWAVKPADADGADGRTRIEVAVDPGTTLQEHMAVKNLGTAEATFALSAADGLFNQNGRFDMLPAGQESVDAGTWVDLPSTVVVPAGATVVVPVTIAVPDDATPGEHSAGVAASIVSDAGAVQVVSRVGFRVAVDVGGEVAPVTVLTVTGVDYRTSWSPLRPGTVEVRYTVSNDGNVRTGGEGEASVSGLLGTVSSAFEVEETSPGQTRHGSVVVDGVWPGLRGSVELSFSPHVVGAGGGTAQPRLEETAAFWAAPWPQLAGVALGCLLVLAARSLSARRRRRLESHVDELVEARLRAASAAHLPTPLAAGAASLSSPTSRTTRRS